MILMLILITHVTRYFFKILVCPGIRTPNLRITRPTRSTIAPLWLT